MGSRILRSTLSCSMHNYQGTLSALNTQPLFTVVMRTPSSHSKTSHVHSRRTRLVWLLARLAPASHRCSSRFSASCIASLARRTCLVRCRAASSSPTLTQALPSTSPTARKVHGYLALPCARISSLVHHTTNGATVRSCRPVRLNRISTPSSSTMRRKWERRALRFLVDKRHVLRLPGHCIRLRGISSLTML